MTDYLDDCSSDMAASDHHAEAAPRHGSPSATVQALLALDDSLRTLVALQERQTCALERLAAVVERTATHSAMEGQLRAVSWKGGTA